MRLGGFVIHGNNARTLGPCLESLAAVCDDLVAVDSGSCDGSATLAASHGFRVLRRPWEGFGAARAAAVGALTGCDWVLFLDSDEWLEPPSRDAIRRFKRAPPDLPYVALTRRNWGGQLDDRFLYRSEHHVRLVRRGHARWDRSMIVHEVLPPARTATLDAAIEHLFATDLEAMRHKLDEYALLWALRSHRDGKRPKWPPLQRAAHLVREMLLKGALFRGRREAIALALMMSEHHARKYRRLREVAAGEHSDLVALLDEDRLRDVFRLVRERAATCAAAGPLPERREPTPARERVLVAVAADAGNLLGPRAAGHPDAAGRPGRGARVG